MKFKFNDTLKTLVMHDLANNQIPMLLGEPGIGKSSWVEDLAKEMKTKSFTLACNQLADKSDLTGARLVPTTDAKGRTDYTQKFYPHVVISKAIKYAEEHPKETPILFLDELNRTTSDVTSEALSIPTMRSIGDRPLPANLRIITAGNDKGNVTSLDTASVSRFVLYQVEPDVATFEKLDQNLNHAILVVLRKHPDYIFAVPQNDDYDAIMKDSDDDDDDDDDRNSEKPLLAAITEGDQLNQLTTPRTISGLSNWLNSFTNDELKALLGDIIVDKDNEQSNALREAIIAHTGKTEFSDAVADEILDEVNDPANDANQKANQIVVNKPAHYDQLKQAETLDDADQLITDVFDSDEVEQALIYALYDKESLENIIKVLVAHAPKTLTKSNTQLLTKLALDGKLNPDNVDACLNASGDIVRYVSPYLSITNE